VTTISIKLLFPRDEIDVDAEMMYGRRLLFSTNFVANITSWLWIANKSSYVPSRSLSVLMTLSQTIRLDGPFLCVGTLTECKLGMVT